MIVGASLNPTRPPAGRGAAPRSGSARSTANVAAASVDDTIAPSSSARRHSRPSSRWTPAAVTAVDTATPAVASAPAGASSRRMLFHDVDMPPSMRMRASAPVPTAWATRASSKSRPIPSSPRISPTARKNSRLGSPAPCATRAPVMLARRTEPPTSSTVYMCCSVIASPDRFTCPRTHLPPPGTDSRTRRPGGDDPVRAEKCDLRTEGNDIPAVHRDVEPSAGRGGDRDGGRRGPGDPDDADPGAAGPAAVVALPLDDRDRAGDGVDPRRARGDDRRVASPPGSPRRAAGSPDAGRHRHRRPPSTSRARASARCSSGSSPTGSGARSCS